MVRIITDSAADFTPQELEQYNIICIPLTVMFADAEYQENINLTKDQFYDLLLSSEDAPKTAQPSPQLLLDLLEDAANAGDEVIYITISSGISGTYQNAVMTAGMADCEQVYVVDGRNATGGQRQVVEHAVRLRDQGNTAAEIAAKLEEIRSRISLYACLDTLEYLYKGGRISHTAYKLGTLANIKPIIHIDQSGHVQVPAKAMGMRKGMDFLCKRLEILAPDPEFPLYVMYTNNRAAAEALAARFEIQGYAIPRENIIQVGAGIGSHIGPNACGMVYIAKK